MAKFSLDVIRHSAAHVLAQAVLIEFPKAKLGIGPSIKDGFYYDFDIGQPLTDAHLEVFENHMNEIIKQEQIFEHSTASKKETLTMLNGQTYKHELVYDLDLPEYSFYTNGPFKDLCKGPHVEHTGQIGTIKLLKVSGAYWKGSEKNNAMQRIYGTAFYSNKDLKKYLIQLEEAKKRDHRVVGKQLELFDIHEDIGSGLITWHPNGARVRNKIEDMWKHTHYVNGYEFIMSPHIGKSELWQKSGHLECYSENMYNPIKVDENDYFVKPMNCPFHILTYQAKPRSYRDLPVRYAELGTVYRYERSGVLHGLFRVRGFTQDDAHIICTPDQAAEEIDRALKLSLDMLELFGFSSFKLFLSTRPTEKAVGEVNDWKIAEQALEESIKRCGKPYEIDEGGGAFYGPKIDIKIEDAIGREWQCSTIQFDFNLPERFDMNFITPDGSKQRPFMIHRALLGSLERFFGILIEHYNGKFPSWLAPIQCRILTITDQGFEKAKKLEKQLKHNKIHVEVDKKDEKLGYKIRKAILDKVPYIVILGKKELESDTYTLKSLRTDQQKEWSEDNIIKYFKQINEEKKKEDGFDKIT